MFNKFEKALKKGMKALKTPAGKMAFRSFVAEACLELAGEGKGGSFPTRTCSMKLGFMPRTSSASGQ